MKNENLFFLSKRSRSGVIGLLVLVLIIALVPRLLMSLENNKELKLTVSKVSQEEITELKNQRLSAKRNYKSKRNKYKVPPTKFNPNTYSKKDWANLGLSVKQADVVLRFTERGVYNETDFKKIFVIPNELFALIKDSIVYSEKPAYVATTNIKVANENKKKVVIDLNTASQEQLVSIPGIGEYVAGRIINYREKLGGFFKKEQLLEINKVDVDLYSRVEGYFKLNEGESRKISINSADAKELQAHPYIDWSVANSIVKIRNQKENKYKSIEEIKVSVLIDEELFEKIKPYLSL
ncbi:MAG: helix-hairpin-helix domain-containing protein [Crocinitomicaceae bacterium]|nr:helix-hairpin-helix domain-containing protein [Crocinitomicaceae bacterium]